MMRDGIRPSNQIDVMGKETDTNALHFYPEAASHGKISAFLGKPWEDMDSSCAVIEVDPTKVAYLLQNDHNLLITNGGLVLCTAGIGWKAVKTVMISDGKELIEIYSDGNEFKMPDDEKSNIMVMHEKEEIVMPNVFPCNAAPPTIRGRSAQTSSAWAKREAGVDRYWLSVRSDALGASKRSSIMEIVRA